MRTKANYVPALDGVRAFAVVVVVACHTSLPAKGGGLGVDVFFVLSGYLITRLLLAEHDRRGRVSLRLFYVRRALRLTPALVAMVVAVLALAAVVGGPGYELNAGLVASALGTLAYLGDLIQGSGFSVAVPFGHTWSLATEEHFYLLWPPLLVLLLQRGWPARRLLHILGAFMAVMITWGVVLYLAGAGSGPLEFCPLSRPIGLPLGSAFAVLCWRSPLAGWRDHALTLVGWLAVPLLLVATIVSPNQTVMAFGGRVVIDILALGLLHVALTGASGSGLLRHPAAVAVGKRSYGIYLWHYPIFRFITDERAGGAATGAALKLAALAVVVELSYRYIEQPFLRMKERFASDEETRPFARRS